MVQRLTLAAWMVSLFLALSCWSQDTETTKIRTATVAPSPGFVYTPYTIPPRMVDARGKVSGEKLVCPYTQKPFILPENFGQTDGEEAKGEDAITLEDVMDLLKAGSTSDEIIDELQKHSYSGEADAGTLLKLKKAGASSALLAAVKRAADAASLLAPVAVTQPKELPYGIAIPGRVGFVLSPYAAKNELVDVTGFPTGMEVKCPYSGKLFRVPPQPKEEPAAPAR